MRTYARAEWHLYLTQSSIPTALNPMINKMADEASAILLLICSLKVWVKQVKVTYDWSTALCLCFCLVDPVLTSQSYDISISISTRRTNTSVFPELMLMSPVFSLAYTCACVYSYARALVKTRL